MYGLHPELGVKGAVFAIVLELLFLGICLVLAGHGWTELRRHKNFLQNASLILFSFALAAGSLYMTYIFLEG